MIALRTIVRLTCLIVALEGCSLLARDRPKPKRVDVVHRIRFRGETLEVISAWYTGSRRLWPVIVERNPGLNPRRLRVGSSIKIPGELVMRTQPLPRSELSRRSRVARAIDAASLAAGQAAGQAESSTRASTLTPETLKLPAQHEPEASPAVVTPSVAPQASQPSSYVGGVGSAVARRQDQSKGRPSRVAEENNDPQGFGDTRDQTDDQVRHQVLRELLDE